MESGIVILAIILGIVVGAIGFVPFVFAVSRMRTIDPTDMAGLAGTFMLPIAVSFIVLAAGIIACRALAFDQLIPFTVSELVVFLAAIVIMGARRAQRGK